jgi:hypothetical protein
VGRRIRIPRVIVLTAYERFPKARVRFSRLNIYARDGNTCQYCGRTLPRSDLNLDHVIPRSRGGTTSWENVVCSCIPCNLIKGGRTPAEAGMRLLHAPSRPRWGSGPPRLLNSASSVNIPTSPGRFPVRSACCKAFINRSATKEAMTSSPF